MSPSFSADVSPRHAIVCGSSIAGLLTAGLLARHFERVTVVERDTLEDAPTVRKGAPQGTQTHVLLKRGMDIAASIFPGLVEDLRSVGAQALDMAQDNAWHVAGVWRKRVPSGVVMHSLTRPLFEWRVRTRLAALPNVRILDRHDITGLLHTADGARVTGIKVRAPGSTGETHLEADLVVDASGRGSRTPRWLEALGLPRVEESRIQTDVGYSTRLYHVPPGFDAGWRSLIISPELPTHRFGTAIPVEGNRWTVTVCGWLKDYPPTDDEGFLAYTRSLARPHLYDALKHAEPAGPILGYRFAHSQWRHYERLPRVPEGLLVVGDAFCSFNPIYGQGITSSAVQVDILAGCLREGLRGLSRRYFERAGRFLEAPWAMSTTEDFRLPGLTGPRPFASGFLHWYIERFQRLTASDDEAVRTFVEVMHMLRPPTAMFSPGLAWKVLTRRPVSLELPRPPEPRPLPVFRAA